MPIDSMRRSMRHLLLAALWLVPAHGVGAQGTSRAGTRVRVTIRDASPGRATGTLVAIVGDTMRLTPDGDSATREVLLARVTRLEVSRGIHRHTLQGFLTGVVAGAFTGLIAGYASGDDPPGDFLRFTRADKAAILGAGLGVIGGGVGALVGFAHRSEDWQTAPSPYVLTLAPLRGGMTVAVRVAF